MLEGDFHHERFSGFCLEAGTLTELGREFHMPPTSPLSGITALRLAEAQWSPPFSVVFTLCSPGPMAVTFREQGKGRWAGFSTHPSLTQPAGWMANNAELQTLIETDLLQIVPSAQLVDL